MTNGDTLSSNGQKSPVVTWLPFVAVILTILFAVFASAKDTPTRTEMKDEDARLEARITARIDRMNNENIAAHTRMEEKIDKLILLMEGRR